MRHNMKSDSPCGCEKTEKGRIKSGGRFHESHRNEENHERDGTNPRQNFPGKHNFPQNTSPYTLATPYPAIIIL